MRNLIIAALLAATSFTPALAQDRDTARADVVRERFGQRFGDPDRMRGGGERQQRQAQTPQAQAPQPSLQPRVEMARRGDDGGDRNGSRGSNRGWNNPSGSNNTMTQTRNHEGRRHGGEGSGWGRRDDGTRQASPPSNGGSVYNQNRREDHANRGWDRNRNDHNNRGWDRGRNDHDNRSWDRGRNDRKDRGYNRPNYGQNNHHRGDNWGNGRNGWDHGWRNNNRYDWQGYRNRYNSYYRMPRYSNPYGYRYGYSRFGIGLQLDNLLFSSRYWISDPWYYRLPAAPYGHRWVRYYDDVLLVDIRDGYVVDVIHDFFY